MSKLLEKAFTEAFKLPEEEQDAFAEIILEELASEKRWDEAFERSHERLAQLADKALSEFRAGKTRPFEPDR